MAPIQKVSPQAATTRRRRGNSPRSTASVAPTRPELPKIAEIICDQVADLLTHGGHQDAVRWLILAALGHYERKRFGQWVDNPAELEKHVDEMLRRDLPDAHAELRMYWKQNQRKPATRPEPKTITDQIRANVIGRVREEFDAFLCDATPEEHRLMYEILTTWRSSTHGTMNRGTEVTLGLAFSDQLDSPTRSYIKVPEKLVEQVEKYVQCLMAAERGHIAPACK